MYNLSRKKILWNRKKRKITNLQPSNRVIQDPCKGLTWVLSLHLHASLVQSQDCFLWATPKTNRGSKKRGFCEYHQILKLQERQYYSVLSRERTVDQLAFWVWGAIYQFQSWIVDIICKSPRWWGWWWCLWKVVTSSLTTTTPPPPPLLQKCNRRRIYIGWHCSPL